MYNIVVKRPTPLIVPLFILVVATMMGAVLGPRVTQPKEASGAFGPYTGLLSAASEWYAEEVPLDRMVYHSIRSMLIHLDPHSYFLTPDEYHVMMQRQRGRFSGLGIMVSKRDGKIMVISPIEGTPAYRLGIRAGDIITQVEDTVTEGLTIDEVVDLLRGPEGSKVTITIRRDTVDEPLVFSVVREVIPETSVRYAHMLKDGIGYVRISEFNRTTAEELGDKLKVLADEGMVGLILDLRGNPGGVLEQSVEVADFFLKPNQMVVYTKGRTPQSYQEFKAPGKYTTYGIPLVVLVDAGSASASEIVAGALQDHDRALIAGTDTFGKGLVQSVYELHNKAALALTTAKYFTPSGRCIQRPYDDLFKYYRHDKADLNQLEHFSTDHKRTVYGGGGIHPDVILESQPLPPFQQKLLARGTYFNFSLDYVKDHSVPRDFRPDAPVLDLFRNYLVEQGIATGDEFDTALAKEENQTFTNFFLRREILSAGYGMEHGYRSVIMEDRQVSEALNHFDEAMKLWNIYSNSSATSHPSSS